MTPAGIEPATFRFKAQHLKHCATAVPNNTAVNSQIAALKITSFRELQHPSSVTYVILITRKIHVTVNIYH